MRWFLLTGFWVVGCLLRVGASAESVTLTWIATGDDGGTGTAAEYDLRYSKAMIYEYRWNDAVRVTGVPRPKPAGSFESVTIYGLESDVPYFFALKVADEAHNWSRSSNVVRNAVCLVPCAGSRGNVDGDALDHVTVSDVSYLCNYLFGDPRGPEPPCPLEANVDGDSRGRVNVGDLNYLLEYLFGRPSGPPPPSCPQLTAGED
jgi:hypothetical protein